MLYSLEEALEIIRKLIADGRKKGITTTLIVKDDAKKVRVMVQKLEPA